MFKVLSRNLRYLFVLNIAFGFSVQLISPLFPLYLAEIGANESQNALVISIGGLVATVLMLPSGILVNKVGRKKLLIGGAVTGMISIFLLAFASTWQQVMPIFMLYSVSMALFMPARMAMISANSNAENRASVFGLMNTAWPIAGVVSPLISGYLIETTGWRNVFLVGSAINFLSIIPGLMIKSRNKQDREESNIRIRDVLDRGTVETLTIFFIYGTLMTTALGAINLIIPLYLDSFFSLSASQIGLFFTAQSFLNLITQIPSGRLADRFGKKKIVLTLIAPLPFMFAAWHFIGNWTWLLVINSLAFGLWSMTWPALLALLSDSVPDEAVGVAFGINTTGNRLGFTIGPLVASYFYINYSKTTPFLVAGTITLIAVLFAFKLKDRVRERKLLI